MMYIVTTTINQPTVATLKFCELVHNNKNWHFVIIGDLKTPHDSYIHLENIWHGVKYMRPEEQTSRYPELSEAIGWNKIMRRNIGFVYAYEMGAGIIATIDDDNIPYDTWGKNILVGKTVEVNNYVNNYTKCFDPFSVTNYNSFWHRGFPVEEVPLKNHISLLKKAEVNVLVQADFWDGDPDIDSICRLVHKPLVKFDSFEPFTTFQPAPFNTQNTFLHRSLFPRFSVWPYVGRMDDIWPSYRIRKHYNNNIVYCKPTVYQERNPQDLVTNLENECLGYRNTLKFINGGYSLDVPFIPDTTKRFIDVYEKCFK